MLSYFKFEDVKNVVPIPEPGNRSFGNFYLEKVEKFPGSWFVDASRNEKLYFAELASRIRHCSSNLLRDGYKKGQYHHYSLGHLLFKTENFSKYEDQFMLLK